MKLTKETLKQIIKEEMQSFLSEGGGESVTSFIQEILTDRFWMRTLSKGSNGFARDRYIKQQVKVDTLTTGDRVNAPDNKQLLRGLETIVQTPGLETTGYGYDGTQVNQQPEGYQIQIFITAIDNDKSTNSAFNPTGNQSRMSVISKLQAFPENGTKLAKVLMEKEKSCAVEISSAEWLQNVVAQISGGGSDKARENLIKAVAVTAEKVYGVPFNLGK